MVFWGAPVYSHTLPLDWVESGRGLGSSDGVVWHCPDEFEPFMVSPQYVSWEDHADDDKTCAEGKREFSAFSKALTL